MTQGKRPSWDSYFMQLLSWWLGAQRAYAVKLEL